jgi:carbon-monoxide dehydrogenase small subunit
MSVETRRISVVVNGEVHEREVAQRRLLVDFLRHDLHLTGTHIGCGHGVCGACTVLLDGRTVRSCLLFAVQADRASLTTVEGLASDEGLHPVQQAFCEEHALQCGFCTPGFLLTVVEFLAENPRPTREEIREALVWNICRCTGYVHILRAVQNAAAKLAETEASVRQEDGS